LNQDARRRSWVWRLLRRCVIYPELTVVALAIAGLAYIQRTRYPPESVRPPVLAVVGATVLVGPDLEAREDYSVLNRDGAIVEVGPTSDVDVPADAEIVELPGATLPPGLIDLHVHLGMPALAAGERMGFSAISRMVVETARHSPAARRAFLEHGVTTIRSLGDDLAWILELRRLVADGELEGPRVYAAGPVFTTPGGHPIVTMNGGRIGDPLGIPDSPEAARRAVRYLADVHGGVDLIKVIQERGRPGRRANRGR